MELGLDGEDTADNLLGSCVTVLLDVRVEGGELVLGGGVDGGLRRRGLVRMLWKGRVAGVER